MFPALGQAGEMLAAWRRRRSVRSEIKTGPDLHAFPCLDPAYDQIGQVIWARAEIEACVAARVKLKESLGGCPRKPQASTRYRFSTPASAALAVGSWKTLARWSHAQAAVGSLHPPSADRVVGDLDEATSERDCPDAERRGCPVNGPTIVAGQDTADGGADVADKQGGGKDFGQVVRQRNTLGKTL